MLDRRMASAAAAGALSGARLRPNIRPWAPLRRRSKTLTAQRARERGAPPGGHGPMSAIGRYRAAAGASASRNLCPFGLPTPVTSS
jgi:hypothetical protein